MSIMNILFFTDNFHPESNAPAIRAYEHSKEWVKQGHSVTIITSAPNFPEGKLYPGYKNSWYQKEKIEGIDVVRIKTYMTANEGVVKRTLDYTSFMCASLLVGLFIKKADVVVATSPQFFCACSGFAVAKLKRKPFIFELRDFWPESIKAVGAINKTLIISFFEKIEQFLYKKSDLIIPVTQSFKKTLIERDIDSNKICVVRNGVDLEKFYPRDRDSKLEEEFNIKGKTVVGYIGTHGLAHSLITLVQVAEILQDRNDIVFMFVGSGAIKKQLLKIVNNKRLENILFIDRQPHDQIARYWSMCDLSIIHLRNLSIFKDVIPSKIFESMAMGIPILLGQPKGEATEIINKYDLGIVISPENKHEMVDAITELADDKEKRNAFKINAKQSKKEFDRKLAARKMLDAIESIM